MSHGRFQDGPLFLMSACITLHPYCRVHGNVTGSLPASWESWSRLRSFEVSSPRLSGTVPVELFMSCPALESFVLSGSGGSMTTGANASGMGGVLPAPFNCTRLRNYSVQHMPVTAAWLSDSLSATLQLESLGLGAHAAHTWYSASWLVPVYPLPFKYSCLTDMALTVVYVCLCVCMQAARWPTMSPHPGQTSRRCCYHTTGHPVCVLSACPVLDFAAHLACLPHTFPN